MLWRAVAVVGATTLTTVRRVGCPAGCVRRAAAVPFLYTAACACVRASIDTQFSTLMCTTRLRVCVEKTAVGVVCYYVCVCSRVIGPIFFTL